MLFVLSAPGTRAAEEVKQPETSSRNSTHQQLPTGLAKPTPAPTSKLPAVFTKAVPGSTAELRDMEKHVQALIAKVSGAVLAVEVGDGTGSGIVISPEGLVLTAGHVCIGPNREARFYFPDGRMERGKTLGMDRDSDTGMAKLSGKGPWPFLPVGDASSVKLGDWALALGHPGGFDAKRSLVSRLGRVVRLEPDSLQTDCTISMGDSGGPLVDMHGRVIGIHTAISTSMSENYHVPISEFFRKWNDLSRSLVKLDRPAGSVYFGAISKDEKKGCVVTSVDQNSPASKAGLKVGDVILRVEDREVKVSSALNRWLEESQPGETLRLVVKRSAATVSLSVHLESKPVGD